MAARVAAFFMFQHLIDAAQGKHPLGTARSPKWPAARKAHLEKFPTCAVCGGKEKLEVHHIRPFHLHPDLELDPSNFITLCESGGGGLNCHLAFGHLGSFKSYNADVETDALVWSHKIETRP